MISALYMEEAVRNHPRTRRLQARFPGVPHIVCERYGEIFNKSGQDFRLQKRAPALILAEKQGAHVLPTPPGYGIGGRANYYFSHILNCLYDCRYCFLQGLYQSAHYVFFLNFEDSQSEIDRLLAAHPEENSITFFSGYDGDSFALESLTGFVAAHLDFFRHRPRAVLELRTKSLQARKLEKVDPLPNVVAAFSLTPEPVSRACEHGVPPLERRLALMVRLARHGWPIGLRFDPIIAHQGSAHHYETLLAEVFRHLTAEQIHSVSLGLMRFPRKMQKKLARLYPEEPLLAAADLDGSAQVSSAQGVDLLERVATRVREHVPEERVFVCP